MSKRAGGGGLVEKLGLGHLPIYVENNSANGFVHRLVNGRSLGKTVKDQVKLAKRFSPELGLLPIIESAEIYWKNLGFDKSIAYVLGLIQSEEDPKDLFLNYSSVAFALNDMFNVVSPNHSEIEDITKIIGYRSYSIR